MSFSRSPADPRGPHVAMVGNQLESLMRFRGPLIRDLVARGCRVTAVCPDGAAADREALAALGAGFAPARRLRRGGISPLADLRYLLELRAILRDLRPDAAFLFFIKPVVYGAIAARLAGVRRRIGMIEGLGYAFAEDAGGGMRRRLARAAALLMFRLSLPSLKALVVLNPDDEAVFRRARLIAPDRLERIDGIGVDLDHYAPVPPTTAPVTFTLVARLVREKGVDTFAAAARMLRRDHPEARFVLLGGLDDNPSAIPRSEVERWVAEGVLEWRGHAADIRPHLAETSVLTLPSRYREGLPRSVMEAMAMGRAAIVSDAPGCRDAVTDGVSGVVVPAGDAAALAAAIRRFLETPELIARMGAAARAEAEHRYDVRRVNARLIDLLLG